MIILLVEESSNKVPILRESLELDNHIVFLGRSAKWADAYLLSEDIDCIIVGVLGFDDSDGLTDKDLEEIGTKSIGGWVWCKNHVLKIQGGWEGKIILIGDFISELDPKEIQGIKTIDKGALASCLSHYLKQIEASLCFD